MSLRLAGARQAGLEEEGIAAVARNELDGLDGRQRAALALADAFVTDPSRIRGPLRDDVLRHLTPAEIVEILFDVIAWSKQKVLVSLRVDAAVDADTFTPLGFDAAGKPVIG
jgi:alkylhydroperoxidase family enzyme